MYYLTDKNMWTGIGRKLRLHGRLLLLDNPYKSRMEAMRHEGRQFLALLQNDQLSFDLVHLPYRTGCSKTLHHLNTQGSPILTKNGEWLKAFPAHGTWDTWLTSQPPGWHWARLWCLSLHNQAPIVFEETSPWLPKESGPTHNYKN